MLPAFARGGNATAEAFFEAQWDSVFRGSGHVWRSADETFHSIVQGTATPESLGRALREQIRKTGHPNPAMARMLARLMQSDALLSLRLNRWDIVNAKPGVVTIEVLATLVDSTGTMLWQISGRQSDGVPESLGAEDVPAREGKPSEVLIRQYDPRLGGAAELIQGTPGSPGGVVTFAPTLRQTAHDFGGATTRLLDRWRAAFPAPPGP